MVYTMPDIFKEFDTMHYLKRFDMKKIVPLFLLSLILMILLIAPLTQAASSSQNDLLCKKCIVKEEHLISPLPKINSICLNRCIVSLHVDNRLNQTVIVKVTPRYPHDEAKMIESPEGNITINPMQGKSITYSLRFPKAGNYNLFGDILEVYSTDGTVIKRIVTNDCQISIEYWNLPLWAFLISVFSHLVIIVGFGIFIVYLAVRISFRSKKVPAESILLVILIVLLLISIIYNYLKIFMG